MLEDIVTNFLTDDNHLGFALVIIASVIFYFKGYVQIVEIISKILLIFVVFYFWYVSYADFSLIGFIIYFGCVLLVVQRLTTKGLS